MTPYESRLLGQTRRTFLASGGLALGGAALAAMTGTETDPLAPKAPHFSRGRRASSTST